MVVPPVISVAVAAALRPSAIDRDHSARTIAGLTAATKVE